MDTLPMSERFCELLEDLAARLKDEPLDEAIVALAVCVAGASSDLDMDVEEFLERFSENVIDFREAVELGRIRAQSSH